MILLEMEAHQDTGRTVDIKAPGYSPEQISYHIRLLGEAGLIEAQPARQWIAVRMTWRGHEFLDATRNDTVWQKIKAEIKDRGAAIPFSLLQQLAVSVLAQHLGLHKP